MSGPTDADMPETVAAALARARACRTTDPQAAARILEQLAGTGEPTPRLLIELGGSYMTLRAYARAIAAYDRAIAVSPGNAAAHIGRSTALLAAKRLPEALADALRATSLRPDREQPWIALGRVFAKLSLHERSAKAFRKATALAPHKAFVTGLLLREQLATCDWDGLDELTAEIERLSEEGQDAVSPFYWQMVGTTPQSLLRVARQHSAPDERDALPYRAGFAGRAGGPLRIGYVSGELNVSANGLVMAGVFEQHARNGLKVTAFDNGSDDDSRLRQRITASFGEVVPVADLSDHALAAAVAERGIDVLVNLNGFFGNARSSAFRLRPAPVQVNYLGCPGSMGASFMDYVIADRVVIPPGEEGFYQEKIARLPHSYYPTDRERPIAADPVSREECGLPAKGFVFCCFNTVHKILPETFTSWMNILKQVDGSVMWLIDSGPAATRNLRREAALRGVAPERLVFAKPIPPAEHLARHRLADLFLDSWPCNAHTTATDALWSGLPVLTRRGSTFPGRVAASALTAIGLPELVTHTVREYEDHAVRLAADAAALSRVTSKLAANRLTTPLFDTALFTGHLEQAFAAMIERHRRGLPPTDFGIAAESPGDART